MKELTKAEEQVMQILWDIEEGVVHDIIKELPEPKPAYNTVSTIIRILETKGFVKHKAYGRTYVYSPKVEKLAYTKFSMNKLMNGYFSGSFRNMVSFFAKENNMNVSDLDELIRLAKNDLKNQDNE